MNNQQLWQAALGELELLLSKANFTTWFKNTAIIAFENEKITLAVPNGFTKAWLEKKYHQTILKALRNVAANGRIREIEYKIKTPSQQPPLLPPITPGDANNMESGIDLNAEKINKTLIDAPTGNNVFGLNLKYTFSNFIVGKNNELAHAASLAVAKNPGSAYNPLFIYGGVGLGKTHLLQAIGHKIMANNPRAKVLYVSCEKFTNDYIAAVQNGKANEFEKKYRSVDVLLVDDIQFIAGKERTQEAFFHTFNELHQQNKQVVISSDRPPKAIATLEHRLVSRFEWGMIADISIPDLETKIAIIDAKAKEKNYPLEPEITNYLASVIHNNIRELEGALNRIIAHSQLQNKKLDLEEVKQITASITTNALKKSLTPKHIINVVAEYYDIEINDILGACRKKSLAEPRQIIMFIMREEMKASYPTIGQELGGRDHTTAIHAYEKINRNLKSDDKLRQDVNVIKQRLYASQN
ncbi:MAG: chromosomal replication initiator protein DnaA [Patescibacteria group bacterium]